MFYLIHIVYLYSLWRLGWANAFDLIAALSGCFVYLLDSFSRSQVHCRWRHIFCFSETTVTIYIQLQHHAVRIKFILSCVAPLPIMIYHRRFELVDKAYNCVNAFLRVVQLGVS